MGSSRANQKLRWSGGGGPTFESVLRTYSPSHWWKCQDASSPLSDSGSLNVSSGNAGTGAYHQTGPALPGLSVMAVAATNSQWTMVSSDSQTNQAFSLLYWFKGNNNSIEDTIQGNGGIFSVPTNSNETVVFFPNGTQHTIASGAGATWLSDGNWHLAVLSYATASSGTGQMWIDNVRKFNSTGVGNISVGSNRWQFGTQAVGGSNLQTEVAVLYGTALQQADVSALYNAAIT